MTLETAVIFGGLVHLAILTAGLAMTKVLNWKSELKKLNELSQHVIWTHAAYVWFTILAFGLVSLFIPETLVNKNPLGQAVSMFIALFWGARLIIQFFYFDAKPYLTDIWLKLGYHGLTACFAYFTIVYGWVAFG
jgi:hypothetical protein